MIAFYIVITLFVIAVIFMLCDSTKPKKRILQKYGQPIAHFNTSECLNSLAINNSRVDMDFYDDFIIISKSSGIEYCLNKDFKDYKIIGSYLVSILEFKYNNKTLQVGITKRQKKLLEDFFEE